MSTLTRRLFIKLQCAIVFINLPFIACQKKSEKRMLKPDKTQGIVKLNDTGPGAVYFGTPMVLCGANVNGKPNFNVLGNFGTVSQNDGTQIVYVSSVKNHYTNIGIRANKEFSIGFPTESIIARTDYCGVVSGHNVDKSEVFSVQYGKLVHAPIIKECKVCFSCKVIKMFEVQSLEVFFGKIEEQFINSSVVSDGNIDFEKIQPVVFGPGKSYNTLSQSVGIPKNEYRNYNKST